MKLYHPPTTPQQTHILTYGVGHLPHDARCEDVLLYEGVAHLADDEAEDPHAQVRQGAQRGVLQGGKRNRCVRVELLLLMTRMSRKKKRKMVDV